MIDQQKLDTLFAQPKPAPALERVPSRAAGYPRQPSTARGRAVGERSGLYLRDLMPGDAIHLSMTLEAVSILPALCSSASRSPPWGRVSAASCSCAALSRRLSCTIWLV